MTVVEAKRAEMEVAEDCCHHRCLGCTLGIVDKDFGLNSSIYSGGNDASIWAVTLTRRLRCFGSESQDDGRTDGS